MRAAEAGHALISLETLRAMLSDKDTNFGGTLHYRFVLNGRVLREFRTFGVHRNFTHPVDLSWLIAEVQQHTNPIDLRIELTQEN